MCYSEFSTMIPIAGSAYTYAYATMGELLAWIIGWDLVLEYAVGAATVSVSWSSYVVKLLHMFGVELPNSLIHCPFDPTPGIINLPAVIIIVLMSTLLIVGIQESARVNAVIVVVKVAVVLLIIGLGGLFISTDNWHPFIPANAGSFGQFGWSGIARGAGVIFFAYIGFDAVSTAAQEARNPQRDMIRQVGLILARGLVLAALLAPVAVSAQTPGAAAAQPSVTAHTTGTVSDVSGAVIPNAEVVVTSRDGRTSTVHTDMEGNFDAGVLASRLQIKSEGFETATIEVGGTGSVAVVLRPVNFADSVVVTATRGAERLPSAASATVLTSAELSNMLCPSETNACAELK